MLRPIKLADAESIRLINKDALGYEVSMDLVHQQIKKLSSDTDHHFFLVYEDENNGKVIGYVHAEVYASLYSEAMFNVMALAVDSVHHKKGIGKILMQALEQEGRKRGFNSIRLNSGETRMGAHQFYERIGYESNKFQKRYMKTL